VKKTNRTKFRNVPLHVEKVSMDMDMDIMQNKAFVKFMKPKFNLDCIISASTTLGNTCIDLTFTRNNSVQTLPYVSYFSYHRPVLNRLMFSSEQ